MLAYLCYYSDGPDGLMSCEPVTNCSYLNTDDDAHIKEFFQKDKKNRSQPLHCPNKNFPETWIKSEGGYYVFSSDVMDWSSSRNRCLDLGGGLVIINSHKEQETLAKHVRTVGLNALFWIGLTDSQTEGDWRWVDDTNLQRSFWDKPPDDNKDANPLGEDCVVLNARIMGKNDMSDHIYDNTKWMNKNSCGKKKSTGEKKCSHICVVVLAVFFFLSLLVNGMLTYFYFTKDKSMHCETVPNCSNSVSELEQGGPVCTYEKDWRSINFCPDLPEQWFKGNGSFYVFSSHNRNWSSSQNHCRGLDGDLVIISNKEEKEFLTGMLCAIGESDLYWSGSRTDLDHKQLNCAALKGNTQEDVSCLREEKSICEIPCHK
ncbi:uncharacterized protein isoform X2 [Danio rerio]